MNKRLSTIAILALSGNVLMAGGDIMPVEPVVVEETIDDEMKYYASMYLWAAGMSGEATNGSDFEITFKDILESLNMTYMGNVGAQNGKWNFNADIIYMNLSKKKAFLNIKMKAWIVTPTVGYRVMESGQGTLDLQAGARYLYMKPGLTVAFLPTQYTSGNVWDGVIGFKGDYNLSEKWFMRAAADVGGGETDLTWQAFAGVGYKYENFDVLAGYRHMQWEFDDNDAGGKVFNDLVINGPIIGATYKF